MVTLSLSCLILSLSPEEGDQADNKEEEEDCALDRQKCQAALALLRHAKWFQVRTAGLITQSLSGSQSYPVSEKYIRILQCAT